MLYAELVIEKNDHGYADTVPGTDPTLSFKVAQAEI